MEEKQLTEKESLDLITNMIGQAKNYYYENGSSSLLWGISNVVCNVLAYFQYTNRMDLPFNPYYLLVIPCILQFYFHKREKRARPAFTFSDQALVYVWIAFGISIGLLTVVGGSVGLNFWILPIMLLLFAMPTFISGCIKKFPSMIFGGIVCWILSLICFFYREMEAFLMVAAGALFAWVIPGIILRNNFNKKFKD